MVYGRSLQLMFERIVKRPASFVEESGAHTGQKHYAIFMGQIPVCDTPHLSEKR